MSTDVSELPADSVVADDFIYQTARYHILDDGRLHSTAEILNPRQFGLLHVWSKKSANTP